MDLTFPGRIVWNTKYSVGIKSIDEQHRVLVEMIGELQDAMAEGRARDVIGELLKNLISYANRHFVREIALLQKHEYPDLAEHIQQHKELRLRIREFESQFRSGKLVAGLQVMPFLRHWLLDHIAQHDMKYAAFLGSRGVS